MTGRGPGLGPTNVRKIVLRYIYDAFRQEAYPKPVPSEGYTLYQYFKQVILFILSEEGKSKSITELSNPGAVGT